jgi:hypothetical protein
VSGERAGRHAQRRTGKATSAAYLLSVGTPRASQERLARGDPAD